ncbi:anthranilate synthase component II [Algoriphagus chordae]|uniref:Anthranilate synthase component 2 n=1 Tax=Algoriphagus chordae TaxID=237019 RepID=A0A2W7QVH7_9BACT|nr:aminodeoxychorismate/anthranilate synthase component II [Algoriphagus chordae]PZX52578.1 anthranilate synthase component 2 [Algoriphagus chordae]
MLLLIDNFDSFSHMLADLLRQTGEDLIVLRNDVSVEEIKMMEFDGLVLSPGPGVPSQAGNLNKILAYYHDKVPVLGVCLGHQAIGEFFGASLKKNAVPTHGKVHQVRKTKAHPFTESIPESFKVTRYHSLQLANLPEGLEVILETESGEVMGIAHTSLPILGIQYHPEAHLTQYGLQLVQNWVQAMKVVS